MPKIELSRVSGDFGFEAIDEYGHIVKMDSNPQSGGQDFGVRPMQMLLMGLAGCSAIDVISILKKQRQEVRDYKMIVNGDRESNKEPSLWKNINIEFHIYGDVDVDKAQKAVDLSVKKYCSVAATLEAAGAVIKYSTLVHP
ncbi:OsmC family protein [Mucilaginibacter sp.]